MELINVIFIIIVCGVVFYSFNKSKKNENQTKEIEPSVIDTINHKNGNKLIEVNEAHTPEHFLKDTISENTIGTTEYYFAETESNVSSNPWSDKDVSRYSKYYTSDIKGDLTDIGSFFDKTNQFVDTTSPRQDIIVNNECSINDINNIECLDSSRLYNKAPIITNNKNYVISDRRKLERRNNSKNKKVTNGGIFFNNVVGNTISNKYSRTIPDQLSKCSM